jgi:carbamate kinase
VKAPLLVVALGGNALSPPRGPASVALERALAEGAARELAAVARAGRRLLIVHGNGPQVGRLLAAPGLGGPEALDLHVARTQGELGYLLAEALERALPGAACSALVTRVLVDAGDPAFAAPTKPVGPVLPEPPPGQPAALEPGRPGWRRVVASPRPIAVLEEPAIAALLEGGHVVAGGDGGIPLAAGSARAPRLAVVDKDWVASLLARRLGAHRLAFVTDVPQVFEAFGGPAARPIAHLDVAAARARLRAGVFAPGSMAPKVESAADFVAATGRPAVICGLGQLEAALAGRAGTELGR